MAIREYPAHIPVAQAMAGVRSMGIDPTEVHSMKIEEGKITLVVFDLNDQGYRRINDDEDGAITQDVVIQLS